MKKRNKVYVKLPPIDLATGLRLPHGNGCHLHDNCFSCSENPDKCKYLSIRITQKRNAKWRQICLERAQYLNDKYGEIVCEFSGETIRTLASTFNDPDDAWGHHIDRNRNNCTPENAYITKYKYHRLIHDQNIQVQQEDFQGCKDGNKPKPITTQT